MDSSFIDAAVARANTLGHGTVYTARSFWDYAPLSDGCSGGLSKFYALMGKKISCDMECRLHDWLYTLGGKPPDRLFADRLLRKAAARAGNFDWPWKPVRRVWRWLRAWLMYALIRVCGEERWWTK
jgi:hypothetical protein